MKFLACVTTRNRPLDLNNCLSALWNSTVKPLAVSVSDDSPDVEVQQKNRQVVEQYPGTIYKLGPQLGVCANRNNALNITHDAELISFIDDDICVEPTFIAQAIDRYTRLPLEQKSLTILSGISSNQQGHEIPPTKLSFRGYFCPSDVPEVVTIHAAVFPTLFLSKEQWDENIFFGYEDAELCLRAIKLNYQILYCPDLKVLDMGSYKGTLASEHSGSITEYEIYVESARLYVGVKRFKALFPNPFKLIAFISIYFTHMTFYLLKRHSLNAMPKIIRRSQIQKIWQLQLLK